MTIKCQICNQEFNKMITNTHLKKHKITVQEYIKKFGKESLTSGDYREQISKKNSGSNNPNYGNKWSKEQKKSLSKKLKGREPHNKGKKVTDRKQLENIRSGIAKREAKYENNELKRPKPYERTDEIRQKISKSIKQYAEDNKSELSNRAKKAVKTKEERGYDLAFMRGKSHSEETKQKLKDIAYEKSIEKKKILKEKWTKDINEKGFEILEWDDFLTLKCNECEHIFERTLQAFHPCKYNEERCTFCPDLIGSSIPQKEIFEFLKQYFDNIRYCDRRTIWPKELDIFVPELNLAIEYCGLYWHSELNGISRNYHVNKRQLCLDKNIRLITIFEDEWLQKPKIVRNRLLVSIGQINKVYGRNTKVRELSKKESNDFFSDYHLMGQAKFDVAYGLFYNDKLISAMSFKKGQKSRKNYDWEISRYASMDNYLIIGGAQKLFKEFLSEYNPEKVISYSDLRWGEGIIYEKLNFSKVSETSPGYWYFKLPDYTRHHRFKFRKRKDEDGNKTEFELRKDQGYNRIWDCGHAKYVWTNS